MSALCPNPAASAVRLPAPGVRLGRIAPVLRPWRAYQTAALDRLDELGSYLLLWRRQSGKTEVLSTWALLSLLSRPGETVILASASLNVGGEVAIRAATVFWQALSGLRTHFGPFEVCGDGDLPIEDFASLSRAFAGGKLEVRFTHPDGRRSRLKVLAPNPATARGFSGTVFLDEIGFIPNFREVWEAVEPIAASNPSFRLVMCTTPPADTAHYAHELIVPPAGLDIDPVQPSGTWYRSEAGLMIHRVDAWDAEAAGAGLFGPESRVPLSVEQHRALALDKDAWDRNYGLILARTGTAAVSLSALHHAQNRPDSARCLAFDGALPSDWRDRLGPISEPVTVGFDVATTERATSNPSALAVVERTATGHAVRLLFRWKTDDPRVSSAYLREIVSRLRVRRLCIDATNERFFARALRDEFSSRCPVELVVASATITVSGEDHLLKTYLGHLVVAALDDARLTLPSDRWVNLDFRLVRKSRGGFDADVDSSGHHADTFDATKLALHGWLTVPSGTFTAESLSHVRLGPSAVTFLPRPFVHSPAF